ncbi:MAG: class II glutamine amidotransferase [Candidatus Cloacimonetes bacterium]|nr:class II glutamine amidotransferase [Candidatus Cloacimonadota bacterium]
MSVSSIYKVLKPCPIPREQVITRSVMLILAAFVCLNILSSPLSACAMSAMITVQGKQFNSFKPQGTAAEYNLYNDPWDYFGFVMANSTPYSNSDGYGVVAYSEGNPTLSSRNMWYKRIKTAEDFDRVYYTGRYLSAGSENADWDFDVLDNALFSVMNPHNPFTIALCHVRNASGVTYGNHPFWFNFRRKTYTFMHNGYCNSAREFMIHRILETDPDWFAKYPSNYFEDIDPFQWVDTEVMFHYIMSYVKASEGNTLYGIANALRGLRSFLEDPRTGVYNFIMSDGEQLYAFRSTPNQGTNSYYKLSYKVFPDSFYAVRTQTPSSGDTELKQAELVVFSRNHKPRHYSVLKSLNANPFEPENIITTTRSILEFPGINLMITPNPISSTVGQLKVSLNLPGITGASKGKVKVYNLKGQCVLSRDITQLAGTYMHQIDLSGFPMGVYLCRVNLAGLSTVSRFTVVK